VLVALLTHAPAPVTTDTPGTLSATELVVLLSHLSESLALSSSSARAILEFLDTLLYLNYLISPPFCQLAKQSVKLRPPIARTSS
jgi:hypothetical protein